MAAWAEVGAELRALRLAAGISVVEAARRAAVSRSALHRWESGESAPERAALDRLLAGLDAEPRVRASLLTAGQPFRAVPELASNPLGAPAHPGLILKALRTRRRMTQTDLARAAGTTQGTVARWESGSQAPGGELLGRALAAPGATEAEAGWLREDASDAYIPVRTIEEARVRASALLRYEAPVAATIALEREVWLRAARDPRWEGILAEVASVRTLAHGFAGEPDAALESAKRALRLARSSGEWCVPEAVHAIANVRLSRGVSPEEVGRMWAEYMAKWTSHERWLPYHDLWAQFEYQVSPASAERMLYRAMEGCAGDEPPDLDDMSGFQIPAYRSCHWETLAERRFIHDDLQGALAALEQNGYYRREGHIMWASTMDLCLAALRRAGERPWPSLVASFERHRRRPSLTPWERSLLAPHEAWLGLEPLLP